MGVALNYFTHKELSNMHSRDWIGYSEDMFYDRGDFVAGIIYVDEKDYGVVLSYFKDCYFKQCNNLREAYSIFSDLKLDIESGATVNEMVNKHKLMLRSF